MNSTFTITFLVILSNLVMEMGSVILKNPCKDHISKYNAQEKRNSSNILKDGQAISDEKIETDRWVSFFAPGEDAMEYKITEASQDDLHCNTLYPIWINGTHPTKTSPGPIDAVACRVQPPSKDSCGWKSIAKIKWCEPGYFVYKLQRPGEVNSAYCFDRPNEPPGHIYPPLPTVDLQEPIITTITPVQWSLTKKDQSEGLYKRNATAFSIGCALKFGPLPNDLTKYGSPTFEVNLVVRVQQTEYFYKPLMPQSFIHDAFTNKEFVIGEEYIAGNLENSIMCSVNSYWKQTPSLKSTAIYSRKINLKMQVKTDPPNRMDENRVITIHEGETIQLWFEPNFPLTFRHCLRQTNRAPAVSPCRPYMILISTSYGQNSHLIVLPNVDIPGEADLGKTKFLIRARNTLGTSTKNRKESIEFTLINEQNSIYRHLLIQKIGVNVIDAKKRPLCVSAGDPHITPFPNGKYYDVLYEAGDFYLVTLKKTLQNRTFEIQVSHRKCPDNLNVMCNCGVIAREGYSVIGVNGCKDFYRGIFVPVQYATIDDDKYGSILPAPTIQEISKGIYKITLLSGIEIRAETVWNDKYTYMNIHVTGLAYEEYGGLCDPAATTNNAAQKKVQPKNSLFINKAECDEEDFIPYEVGTCERNKNAITGVIEVCDVTAKTMRALRVQCREKNSGDLLPKRKRRSIQEEISDADSVLVDDSIILSPAVEYDPIDTINAQWPTQTKRITENQARSACMTVFQKSPAYAQCSKYIGDLLSSCLTDIQITEELAIAEMFLDSFNSQCLYEIESSIDKDENDTTTDNKVEEILKEIKSKLCPGNCAYKDEQRGECINGTCQCYNGFKGPDCSIKEGVPPTIINLFQNVIDYDASTIPSKHGLVLLVQAENVDYENVTQLSCQVTGMGLDGKPIQTIYPGIPVLGSMVACRISMEGGANNALYRFGVSLSNNANNYSSYKGVIIHDGKCTQCKNSSNCFFKTGQCAVKGICSKDPGQMKGCDRTSRSIDLSTDLDTLIEKVKEKLADKSVNITSMLWTTLNLILLATAALLFIILASVTAYLLGLSTERAWNNKP